MPRTSDARERLMDAAMDLIWGNSYGSTSVDAICEKAGAKKGSFYHFFPSKAELAIDALETDWLEKKKPRMDDIFSASRPPLERIREFFTRLYQEQRARHGECGAVLGCPYFTLGCEISTQDRSICNGVKKILDCYAQYFESAIRDAHARKEIIAPDAKAKARMLVAFFQGSLAQARIDNSVEPLRGLPAAALELLGAKKTRG